MNKLIASMISPSWLALTALCLSVLVCVASRFLVSYGGDLGGRYWGFPIPWYFTTDIDPDVNNGSIVHLLILNVLMLYAVAMITIVIFRPKRS